LHEAEGDADRGHICVVDPAHNEAKYVYGRLPTGWCEIELDLAAYWEIDTFDARAAGAQVGNAYFRGAEEIAAAGNTRQIDGEASRAADRSLAERYQKAACHAVRGEPSVQGLTIPVESQTDRRAERWQTWPVRLTLEQQDVIGGSEDFGPDRHAAEVRIHRHTQWQGWPRGLRDQGVVYGV
jgi:hypothetical protein